VSIEGDVVGRVGPGILVLLAVAEGDDEATARRMAEKCAALRLFAGQGGPFDRSLGETGGEALVVSQFTLLADLRRGRRPSFAAAARPEAAAPLVDIFVRALSEAGVRVDTGRFGAAMQVDLTNDGPVTVVLDSRDLERPRSG
jgi:D-tyrosyl-tRNA(Tyr) deacylase